MKHLTQDTRDLLEPEAWQEMYDAWRAQVTSGLEQLAALGITVAGSGSDSSPKKNQSEAMVDPAEAMAEGRRRSSVGKAAQPDLEIVEDRIVRLHPEPRYTC